MKQISYVYLGILLVVTLLVAISILPRLGHTSEDAQARSLFINLTTGEDDLQKASMGLMLAKNSLTEGRNVTVFLNVHALALAQKSRGDIRIYKSDADVHSLLRELIADGATILACPYCMEKHELELADLIEGIEKAGKENFFPPLDSGAAVFSY